MGILKKLLIILSFLFIQFENDLLAQPSNDDCVNAITITSSPNCIGIDGELASATKSTLTPTNNFYDVWYTFTANSSTHYISVIGSGNFKSAIQVFSGTCGSLTSLNTFTSTQVSMSATVTGLTPGNTYFYRVYHDASNSYPSVTAFTTCVEDFILNDNCSGAIELIPGEECNAISGKTAGATQSMVACKGTANDDVWYKFKATDAHNYINVIGQSAFNSVVELFSGSCASLTSLVCQNGVNSNADNELINQNSMIVGNYYYLRVYDFDNDQSTTPYFSICVNTPPSNDDCSNAKTLSHSDGCQSEFTDATYATQSLVAGSGKGTANDDVWFKFVADTSSAFFTINPSDNYNPVVQLYSNCSTPTTGGITFYDDNSFPTGAVGVASVNGLTKGSTYYFRVYDYASTNPTTMSFNVCVSKPTKNDDCNNAIEAKPNTTCNEISGDGAFATQSLAAVGGKGNANDDVWYKFTAVSTSQIISVNSSLLYDPVVQVVNSCAASPTSLLNDDASFPKAGLGQAIVSGLTIGNTYYYRVYDVGSTIPATTTFTTCVTTAPSNDDCANATQIYVSNTCDEKEGNGLYASNSGVSTCTGTAEDDVWYKFVAQGSSQFISVTPDDANYDPIVQVFSACGTALTPAFCQDALYPKGSFGTGLVTGLTKNQTYYYRIYEKGAAKISNMKFTTCVVNPVSNDDCINAVNITPSSTCTPTSGDGTYATQSLAAGSCGTNANDDVWYKFTATKTSQFISVTPTDSKYDPVIEVFNACPATATPNVTCNDANFPVGDFGRVGLSGLTIGNTYYYRIYDKGATNQDTMTFETCVIEPVSNDDCPQAIALTPSSQCNDIQGESTYATQSLAGCNGTADDDVWYKFTATTTKEFISVTSSKNYDPVIEVYTGCGTPIAPAICNDANFPKNSFGDVAVPTIIGNTYYFRIYDKLANNVSSLPYSVCVSHAPSNDECSGATTVVSGSTCSEVSGEGTYATQTLVAGTCGGNADDDVWFKFNATATSQNIYVNSSLNYDPVVEIYNACPASSPSVICNDARFIKDAQGSMTVSGLSIGNTYYYRVYDKANTSITPPATPLKFTTCVTNVPGKPVNDDPCGALLLTSSTTCNYTTFSNEGATGTTGVPAPGCANYIDGDVWFKTKVPFSGQLDFDMKAMSISTAGIALYRGKCNALLLISCQANGNGNMPSYSQANLTPGDTIWIRVWGKNAANYGSFGLCIKKPAEASLSPACSNLDFESGTSGWFGTTGNIVKGATGAASPTYAPKVFNTLTAANQFNLMTGGIDPWGGFPMVKQGSTSLKLGYESSTNNGRSIEQYFPVTKANANFIYNYAAVLQSGGHASEEQPFFRAELFDDAGKQISCGDYLVAAPKSGVGDNIGFIKSPKGNDVIYKPWTQISIDLSPYIGQNVHVRFSGGSCAQSAHFGYVYLECSCSPFEITGTDKVCVGDTIKLYAPKGGKSYSWKDKNGIEVSIKDSLIIKSTVAGTEKFTCDITLFGTSLCESNLSKDVIVGPTPTLTITDPAPVCSPNTVDITNGGITTGSTANLVYTYWSDVSGTTPLTNQTAITSSGTYYIKGEKSPTCKDIKPVKVVIEPLPKIANKSTTICSGNTFSISPTNTLPDEVPSGTKYKWTVIDNSDVTGESNESTGQSNISQTLTNTSSTPQTVTYTVTPFTPTCEGASFTVTVTVNPQPKISNKTTTICSNNSFEVSPTNTSPDIVPSGTTYTWTHVDNTNVSNEANSSTDETSIKSTTNLIQQTNTVQSVVYTITPKSGTCLGTTFTVTVNVNPAPKIPDFTSTICTGSAFDATPSDNGTTCIVPSGTTFTWTTPTVTGGITGGTSGTNLSSISQTLTNSSATDETASYVITATTSSTPSCSATFNAAITVSPKVQPQITCGTSDATSIEFNWSNITGASYTYQYKIGAAGVLSASQTIAIGITNQKITGLTPGQTVYFTLTPVGIQCPLASTKSCSNCAQPTIVNNDNTAPADFEICLGETITLKSSDTPTNSTQWNISDLSILTANVQGTKNLIDITGSIAGNSDVEFTNDAGCLNSVTVKVNPKPVISNTTEQICSGGTFSLTPDNSSNIIPVGTTYTWTVNTPAGISGNSNQNVPQSTISQTLSNTTNSPIDVIYTVTASSGTNPNQCNSTFTHTVTVNPVPSIQDMNTSICSGKAFSFTPSNGGGNLIPTGTLYTWTQTANSNVSGATNQSVGQNIISETLTNTSNLSTIQIYNITATYGSGASACTSNFKGNVTIQVVPTINPKTTTICSANSFSISPTTDGTDVVPSGTTYTWTTTNPGGLSGQTNQSSGQNLISETLTNSTANQVSIDYTITASVGNSPVCSSTFVSTIIVDPKPTIATQNTSICSEDNFNVNISNGSGNIVPSTTTYTWTTSAISNITGNINESTSQTSISQKLTNTSSTAIPVNYQVTAENTINGNTCSSTFDLNVNVLPKPKYTQAPIDICTGNNFSISPTDGNGNIIPNGTTFTWTVNLDPTVSGGNNQSTPQNTISETLTTTDVSTRDANYTITASSNSTPNCTSTFPAIIHVNPQPSISTQNITVCSATNFICSPTTSNGDVVPSGTIYTWTVTPPTGITGASDESTGKNSISQTLTNNSSNPITVTYNITGTVGVAPNICSSSFLLNVTVNPNPNIPQQTSSICSGETFTISPVDNPPTSLVPTGTTYTWTVSNTTGTTGTSSVSIPTSTISQTISNNTNSPIIVQYDVIASLGSAPTICTSSFTSLITVNSLPDFTPTATSQCENDPLYLQANFATATNVVWTGPNNYTNSANSDSKLQVIAKASSINDGNYSVEVTDQNGCKNAKTVTVKINSLPIVNAGIDQSICIGSTATLIGNGALSYIWDNGIIDNIAFTPSVTKTYKVTGTDAKGCQNTDDVVVTVNNLPTVSAGQDQSICIGDNLTLSGTGASTYTWDNNVVDNTPFSPSNTTDYTVTGTDVNGCKNTDVVHIIVNQLPVFTPTAIPQCENDPLYLQANFATATNIYWTGPNGYTFTDTKDAKITAVAKSSINDNGVYTVEVTDQNGCKKTNSVSVSINLLPIVDAGLDQSICIGNSVTLSAKGALSYNWDNGVIDNSPFSPTQTKIYKVTGTDSKGCQNTDNVEVFVNPLPNFTLSVNDPCEQQSLNLNVDLTNNPSTSGIKISQWVGPNSFTSTSINPSIQNVTSNASGIYTLTLTDNNNCVREKSISAFINPVDNIVFADINPKCVNDPTFFLPNTNIPGGTWSSDDNTSIQNPYTGLFDPTKSIPDQDYKVVVTYSTISINPPRKCPSTKSKVIFVNPIPDSLFHALNPTICIDDTLHLLVDKPNPQVTYTWDLGNGTTLKDSIANYVYTSDGTYSISLFASLGNCKVSKKMTEYIHVIAKPTHVDFSQSANEIDFYNPEIQFHAFTNGKYLLWNFGDGTTSTYKNPSHKFPEIPGEYPIELKVSNMENNYCSNTVIRSIFMPEPVIYFIPNTFTPNGDELNNTFQPVFTSGYDPQHYTFYIYNRWGELIFESHDTKIGWDGTYGDNLVQNDTYIWKLEFKEKIQEFKHVKTGHVNVLR